MQVIANRQALSEAVALAGSVVAARTPKPVLQCVKLSATAEGLLLSATDLEIGVRYAVQQVEVGKTGEAIARAQKLEQIVRELPDETLQVEADAGHCHVRGQNSHFELSIGAEPRDFPPVAAFEGPADVEVEAGVLRRLIEQTLYAAARESTRYAINGVLWETKGRKLVLVATDGRRLAKAAGPVTKMEGEEASRIVPTRAMHTLLRLLGDPEAKVAIKLTANQLIVQCGPATLSSVLVEGNFPDYDKVIPRDNDKKVELNAKEFHDAVRLAALLTSEQSKGVRLAFTRDGLVLAGRAPEEGAATISVKVDYAYDPIEIGFNPGFLTDVLKGAEADTFTLELKESDKPGIVRMGKDFLYVVMPVSLS